LRGEDKGAEDSTIINKLYHPPWSQKPVIKKPFQNGSGRTGKGISDKFFEGD
jgi:hypothetical protein